MAEVSEAGRDSQDQSAEGSRKSRQNNLRLGIVSKPTSVLLAPLAIGQEVRLADRPDEEANRS
jgi:hypothetical protein